MTLSSESILSNARIVLRDEVISGTVVLRDGVIADVATGNAAGGEDMEGDYIVPGLVELHTDHLEGHYAPRPGVRWNMLAAIQAHDAQIATSGITTVFDCLRMGTDHDHGYDPGEMRLLADTLEAAEGEQRLRAEHFIHLRCEVSSPQVLEDFESFAGHERVRLASLMDHAPGQRQFQTMDQYTLYYKTKRGLTDEEFERFVAERVAESERYSTPNRKVIADYCTQAGITLASHDDATLDHVGEAIEQGVRLAEFPTSLAAAQASHEAGMSVLMGAPNVVRGGSHSGNVAALDLARAGCLDVLSSDYIPFSLIHAAFSLTAGEDAIALPHAVAMITDTPARTVGLDDRGRIETGRRADLVRARLVDDVPVIRSVWRGGSRVA